MNSTQTLLTNLCKLLLAMYLLLCKLIDDAKLLGRVLMNENKVNTFKNILYDCPLVRYYANRFYVKRCTQVHVVVALFTT